MRRPTQATPRFRPRAEALERRALLATLLVTSVDDSGPGSLRQAILDANADPGPDAIAFAIPGDGVPSIRPRTELPPITAPLLLDGWSQPGEGDGPRVEIRGDDALVRGLTIAAPDVTVRGLAINGFAGFGWFEPAAGIALVQGATRARVQGNAIGTDPSGTVAVPNEIGVLIKYAGPGNVIGTDDDGLDDRREGNLISGNHRVGVSVEGETWSSLPFGTASGTVLAGNRIGTDASGLGLLPGQFFGITVGPARDTQIGGPSPAGRNILGGDGPAAILVGPDAWGTLIRGNWIGLGVDGRPLAEPDPWGGSNGIRVMGIGTVIGGPGEGEGNRVAARSEHGIILEHPATLSGNLLFGNLKGSIRHDVPAAPGPAVAAREGWVEGLFRGVPLATYRVELFAGRGQHPSGEPEAEAYLGVVEVTTGADGLAAFELAVASPEGFPALAATATGPDGVTSALSRPRLALTASAPAGEVAPAFPHAMTFSAAGGNAIRLDDPNGDGLPVEIRLAAEGGRLTLSSTAGLAGSGDGSSALAYSGPLDAILAALDGLRFETLPGSAGEAALHAEALAWGAGPGRADVRIAVLDPGVPFFPAIPARSVPPGSGPSSVAVPGFAVDPDAAVGLVLEAESSDPSVLAAPRVEWDPASGAAVLHFDPAPSEVGATTITLRASLPDRDDPGMVRRFSRSFPVAIAPAERPGSFANLSDDLSFPQGSPAIEVFLALNPAPGGDPALDVDRVVAWSDGVLLEPDGSVLPTHNGVSIIRFLVRPRAVGAETIRVAAIDRRGEVYAEIAFEVELHEIPPSFNPLVDLRVVGGRDFPPVGLSGLSPGSGGVVGEDVTFSVEFDNGDLIEAASVERGADGTAWVLRLARRPGGYGFAWVTVTLADADGRSTERTFLVEAVPEPEPAVGVVLGPHDRPESAVELGPWHLQGPGSAWSGTLGPSGVHYFSFGTAEDGRIEAEAHAPGGGLRVSLLDAQGRTVVQSLGAGPGAESTRLAQHVTPGRYFLRIEGPAQAAGAYSLRVSLQESAMPGGPFVHGNPNPTFGDFDGDGLADIISIDTFLGLEVGFFRGLGDGTFAAKVGRLYDFEHARFLGTGALAPADFDGDGRLDLAVAAVAWPTHPGTGTTQPGLPNFEVMVYFGLGDGTFASPVALDLSAAGASRIVAVDLGGGPGPDLVVVTDDGRRVEVRRNRGDGTFFAPAIYAFDILDPAEGGAIAIRDVDGDGRPDLAGPRQFWRNRGDGAFEGPFASTGPPAAEPAPTPLDLDGDGRPDRVALSREVSWYTPGSLVVGLGIGGGRLLWQVAIPPSPGAMPLADLNGDGRLDLVGQSASMQSLVIRLSRGDLAFGQPAEIPGDVGPGEQIRAADLNGDGRPDLIIPGADWTFSVLLGRGDGTFLEPARYGTTFFRLSFEVADADGDGHPDVLVGTYDASFVLSGFDLYRNLGDGTFADAVPYGGFDPSWKMLGDFDGDDRPDIFDLGAQEVRLARPGGGFAAPVPLGTDPIAIVEFVDDMNGDGFEDLVALHAQVDPNGYRPVVWLGRGDGTFEEALESDLLVVASLSQERMLADVDGDGLLDVVGNFIESVVFPTGGWSLEHAGAFVLYGRADGRFERPVFLRESDHGPFHLLGTADLNGDGRADLLAAVDWNQPLSRVALAGGRGEFRLARVDRIDPAIAPPTILADLDGDGVPDAATLDGRGRLLWRRGLAELPGTFAPAAVVNHGAPLSRVELFDTPAGPRLAGLDARNGLVRLYARGVGGFEPVGSLDSGGTIPLLMASGDVDGDGRPDLAVYNAGSGTIALFLGSPSGELDPGAVIDAGLGLSDLVLADVDGSGRPDLVATRGEAGLVTIRRNDGLGGFLGPEPYRAATFALGFATLDGEPTTTTFERSAGLAVGPEAVYVANRASMGLAVLPRLGARGLADPRRLDIGFGPESVAPADLDRDGREDLVVVGSGRVAVLLADGAGGFRGPFAVDAGADPTGVSIHDVDGDGIPDLLIGNAQGDLLVRVGLGDGTFRAFVPRVQSIALATADLDGDGRPDFVFANEGLDRVTVHYAAEGEVRVVADRADGLLTPGSVHLADLDGDGRPDLVVANTGGNAVMVYPGIGGGQFGPALNQGRGFAVGTAPTDVRIADVSGDGRPDLVVVNSGSNDVSILLNQAQGAGWSLVPGPRVQTAAGPASVAVADFTGDGRADLAVGATQSDVVQVFRNVGGGFFDDRSPTSIPVAGPGAIVAIPSPLPSLGTQLAVLQPAGSTGVLIPNPFLNPGMPRTTFPTGGLNPTAFVSLNYNADPFVDLLVANGDGVFALLQGSLFGFSVAATTTSPAVARPTGLALASSSPGFVEFYAATAGREAAFRLTFQPLASQPSPPTGPGFGLPGGGDPTLGGPRDPFSPTLPPGTPFLPPLDLDDPGGGDFFAAPAVDLVSVDDARPLNQPGVVVLVAQLIPLRDSSLALLATLVSVSVAPDFTEANPTAVATDVGLLALFLPSDDPGDGSGGEAEGEESEDGPSEALAASDEEGEPPLDEEAARNLFLFNEEAARRESRRRLREAVHGPDDDGPGPVQAIATAVDAALDAWSDVVERVASAWPLEAMLGRPGPAIAEDDAPAGPADADATGPAVSPRGLGLAFASTAAALLGRQVFATASPARPGDRPPGRGRKLPGRRT